MQDHRKLRVWKHAHELALVVRAATKSFPSTGYGSLQSQTVRAAESIVFNIAEGCGAGSQREFARFLGIGIKSTFELEAECELAKDYGVLSAPAWEDLSQQIGSARRMLFALRNKVLLSPHAARMNLKPSTANREPSTN
ncbi:MAG: four helix bundle protein [Gemmatimonadaceae bacterium]